MTVFDIRSLVLAGVIALTACASSPVTVDGVQAASQEAAAAPLAQAPATAIDNDSDGQTEPAPAATAIDDDPDGQTEPAPPATAIDNDPDGQTEPAPPAPASSAVPVTDPEIAAVTWCSEIASAIQDATDATIEARYDPTLSLGEAVENLHLLFRQAANGRPVVLAEPVAEINASIDRLEPLLRPVEWDVDQIDRDLVDAEFAIYNHAASLIEDFNVEECGLGPAGLLPEDDEIELPETTDRGPQPTPNPLRPPDSLEIDLFLNDVPAATEADARCFLPYRYAVLDGAEPRGALDAMVACGMTIDRLAELELLRFVQTRSPNGPRSDLQIQVMVKQAQRWGMTAGEAECFADAYVGNVEDRIEPEVALEQLLGCGLTLARMDELGIPAGCPWLPNVCATDD